MKKIWTKIMTLFVTSTSLAAVTYAFYTLGYANAVDDTSIWFLMTIAFGLSVLLVLSAGTQLWRDIPSPEAEIAPEKYPIFCGNPNTTPTVISTVKQLRQLGGKFYRAIPTGDIVLIDPSSFELLGRKIEIVCEDSCRDPTGECAICSGVKLVEGHHDPL